MDFLNLTTDYNDPSASSIEVVERKGVGHPDSLADALANEVSVKFSQHCIDNFGCVLHHNVDKLYIGAGHFRNDYGICERISPIRVQTNGRMSNVFGNKNIDIEPIQREAISDYLFKVIPRLTLDDVVIVPNATQCTKVPYWYTPRSKEDIPDSKIPKANDTSFCISHWPPTPAEAVAYRLERYFWENKDGFAIPRFPEIGQDIKVLVLRNGRNLEVTLCVPTISVYTSSYEEYKGIIKKHEIKLQELAEKIVSPYDLDVSVNVNQYQNLYMLGVGSCIECGEEGMVGRGNTISGIISSHRVHTQESWAGKNPVYHTGRVLGYLTSKLAYAISSNLNVKCSVSAMTRAGDSLIPPRFLGVSVSKEVNLKEVELIIEKELLSADYLKEILAFRPWIIEL
jgi:S-adenosylmethionine synthetase